MGDSAPGAPDLSEERDDYERVWVGAYNQGLENIAWQQQQWGRQSAALDQLIQQVMPLQQQQAEWAQETQQRYRDVYQPIEDDLIRDYETYNSGDRIALDRSRAMADVKAAFGAERENASRRLEGYGIDPSQIRGQAMDRDVRLAEAATLSNAANQARLQTEATGRQLRADALQIGSQYPQYSQNAYNSALQAAALPVSATNATINSGMANRNAALQPWQLSANTVNAFTGQKTGNYTNELNEYDSNPTALGTLGSLVEIGTGISGFFADGGVVEGPGGPRDDRAIIAASPGEFVVPEDVVRWKGEEFFSKTIDQARKAQAIPLGETDGNPS